MRSIDNQAWEQELHWLTLTEDTWSVKKEMLELQQMIIDSNDPALAYFFARDIKFEPHKMQAIILASDNLLFTVLFAANIPNADIKALQAKVIKSNDLQKVVEFACFVPNSDYKALEKIVVKSGSAKHAAALLKHSPRASVSNLQRIILASRTPSHLLELARRIRSKKTLRIIEDIIVASKSAKYCRLLARIKGTSVKRLEQVVMESGNAKEIKALARTKTSQAAALSILF